MAAGRLAICNFFGTCVTHAVSISSSISCSTLSPSQFVESSEVPTLGSIWKLLPRTARRGWKSFSDCRTAYPSHDTIERVFSLIHPDSFQRCLLAWLRRMAKP